MALRGMAGFVGGIGGIGAVRSKATICSADGISFHNIGLGSVSLSWTASGSHAYRVVYKSDSNPASFRTVTRSSVILKGLSPGSSYDMSISELDSKKVLSRASFTTMSAEAPESAGAESDKEAEDLPLTELSRLEIRAGTVVECKKHPEADTLYVETIDVGEPEPRTIVSGLVKFMSEEELTGRKVVVLCNLKPRAMRGITSHGMLLCASNDDHSEVDPLSPPEECGNGELITFDGHKSAPIDPGNRATKAFDRVADDLSTNEDGIAQYQDIAFKTVFGPCYSPRKLVGGVS
mmetsp:Transcript_17380/g.70502  ORF Transcript_17380/g.70502 Transcript_17380/m.70502 type:complete len:292 (-) Transcript_17380:267-1142(-)|eukprot:CAMPEP_0113966632 /NCGR_PEP_ID=MMETSP0011_2-20120614/8432_1 /TAXON_ID=101924 /ORGANISM="Rhodosorus marinus" /LENGTH=291 /DNA_ID=CAMNT_0000979325 /DNA_START=136 /DNA_END=1014 /DNA_ORIENTATION=- /assembly_acc=CAM_ASM_000156